MERLQYERNREREGGGDSGKNSNNKKEMTKIEHDSYSVTQKGRKREER